MIGRMDNNSSVTADVSSSTTQPPPTTVETSVPKSVCFSTVDFLKNNVKLEHLAAGVSGGVASSILLHPLDLVKVRFQVDEGPKSPKNAVTPANLTRPKYQGVYHAFRSIIQTDGIKGLYRGLTPNVTGAGVSWGLYFFFYNSSKHWMQDGDSKKNLGPGKHMLLASGAGFATLCLTNPIWVSKTRMILQYDSSNLKKMPGMLSTLNNIFKYEGVYGLYKGFLPGIFGISHGVVQFVVYEELKTFYNNYYNQSIDTRLSSYEYLSFAAISKIIAAASTYPYQVVRSRLQDQHRSYSGALDVVRQIWQYEHVAGFYKGLWPNLLRVTPACAITFFVYESIITTFGSMKEKPKAKESEQCVNKTLHEEVMNYSGPPHVVLQPVKKLTSNIHTETNGT